MQRGYRKHIFIRNIVESIASIDISINRKYSNFTTDVKSLDITCYGNDHAILTIMAY